MKRGQITIFIVVGIFILFVVAGFLFMKSSFERSEIEIKEEKMIESVQLGGNIQNFIESCIWKTGEKALELIGEQGGYYDLPEVYDPEFNLPYYYLSNEDLSPNKIKVEEELAKYMDENLPLCFNNFTSFKEIGYQIKQEEMKNEVLIKDKIVLFKVHFNLEAEKGIFRKEWSFFEISISSRLKTILETNNQIILGIQKRPTSINLGKIYDLGNENNLLIEFSNLEDDVYFMVVDGESLSKQETYDFNFVVRYLFGEEVSLE